MAAKNIIDDPICEAAQSVFSNDLAVGCIFQHVKKKFKDVKTFRLISPTCNRISLNHFSANSKIENGRLKRFAESANASTAFDFLNRSFASSQSQRFPYTPLDVEEFWKLEDPGKISFVKNIFDSIKIRSASSPPLFPCNSIHLYGFWKLDNPGIMSLLEVYGHNISHLSICRKEFPIKLGYLKMLLLHWLPSLHTLKIWSVNFGDPQFLRGTRFLA
ncbi:unnamed protein product, partial [Allacma fusca]